MLVKYIKNIVTNSAELRFDFVAVFFDGFQLRFVSTLVGFLLLDA